MREWFVIERTAGRSVFASDELRNEKGYIPRDVVEALLGKPMDGTVWFSREESEKMRAHPEWRDTEPA
jgi:hypothetical protein